MQDDPSLADLLEAVAVFLRERAAPALEGHAAYEARVSASVVRLAARSLRLGGQADLDDAERLRVLLGRDGTLVELNQALAERLADGTLTLESPGVAAHLWRATLDKAAIDQPDYATYTFFKDRPQQD